MSDWKHVLREHMERARLPKHVRDRLRPPPPPAGWERDWINLGQPTEADVKALIAMMQEDGE
jgi:hypothetical protein